MNVTKAVNSADAEKCDHLTTARRHRNQFRRTFRQVNGFSVVTMAKFYERECEIKCLNVSRFACFFILTLESCLSLAT